MNKLLIAASLSICGSIISTTANAVTIVPDGLMPGDMYRLAFITRDTLDSSVVEMEIDTYNDFVNKQADLVPELAGFEWLAIASSDTVDAWDNTFTNPSVDGEGIPIYLVTPDGVPNQLIANSYIDLWDGTVSSPINLDQTGNVETRASVFPVPGSDPPQYFWITEQQQLNPNTYLHDPSLNPTGDPNFGIYAISGIITSVLIDIKPYWFRQAGLPHFGTLIWSIPTE